MKKWIIFGYWLICVWGIGVAHAKSAEEAEYERLVSEMTKFSKTQSWHGVNKRFAEMEKLGLEIGVEELLMAAQASQGIREIFYQAKERVTQALLLKEKKSTRNWYTQINNEYGQVTLIAKNKRCEPRNTSNDNGSCSGQAIAYAQECLESKGEFRALLPIGDITLVDKS